ncbi:hypothetical protein N1851_020108 [Merluccius polli]|uniref:Uncharacterized protein n=1 Tax=Merluccius polli TaxID=89951 RepID=A0AA47NXA8_MERPO|nr:hypothetical protein N1851_020108 [Merluccius polli]
MFLSTMLTATLFLLSFLINTFRYRLDRASFPCADSCLLKVLKKAEARKTGGGPPPPPLTEAEELALSQNRGRPVAEGIPGGSSSESVTPQDTIVDGVICLVQPPTETVNPAAVSIPYSDLASDGSSKYSETDYFPASQEEEDDDETLSAATGRDPEGPTENMAGHHQEEGPSTSTAQLDTLPVKELYRVHLLKTIQKKKWCTWIGRFKKPTLKFYYWNAS